jgi:hypothetical protein
VIVGFDTDGGNWGARATSNSARASRQPWSASFARKPARLRSYTPFGILHCHASGAPYRSHLPRPDDDYLYGYGDVELVGAPEACVGVSASRSRCRRLSVRPRSLTAAAGGGRPTWTAWRTGFDGISLRRGTANAIRAASRPGGTYGRPTVRAAATQEIAALLAPPPQPTAAWAVA